MNETNRMNKEQSWNHGIMLVFQVVLFTKTPAQSATVMTNGQQSVAVPAASCIEGTKSQG